MTRAPDISGLGATHLAALEDLCPGMLVWLSVDDVGAWRRGLAGAPHASATINDLMARGFLKTSHDNLIIAGRGIDARDALRLVLRRRAANPLTTLVEQMRAEAVQRRVSNLRRAHS